jgi:Plasmid replication region DNA-binding N-term
MPKNSVTYLQVAEACQSLLAEGQKITSRALLARCGGSPNELAVHRKKWQAEQDDIALVAIDEELSQPVKQAILAEYARKIAQVKAHFAKKMIDSEQQFQDLQAVLTDTEQHQQIIQTELTEAQNRLIEQNAKQALLEQRWADAEKHLKEIEGLYQNTLLTQERIQAEKMMADKQATDWQNRYHLLEQEFKALLASKHQGDIEIAIFKAHLQEKVPH